MNGIQRMDHFTIVTARLDETCEFYQRLGLSVGPRPDFGIPGQWLYARNHAVLHLVQTNELPVVHRGALDHMAFHGGDIVATLNVLRHHHIAYRLLRLPRPWSTWQVFFDDPNGVEVEIDFDASQTVPPQLKDGRTGP
jgi:catechol 2,3-dioxygenase-like lactoylglutathione lyase family enzyme